MIYNDTDESEWDSNDETEQILMEIELQHRIDDKIRGSTGYAIAIDTIPMIYIKQDTINRAFHSYNMKHDMAYYLKCNNIKQSYCTNDEFILAMIDLGFNSQPSKSNEDNFNFNIKETKELHALKKCRYSK